jgi:putative transposase
MRNTAVKMPEDRWPEFKARAIACYQGPSRAHCAATSRLASADFETELVSAVRCFTDDFKACIVHLG